GSGDKRTGGEQDARRRALSGVLDEARCGDRGVELVAAHVPREVGLADRAGVQRVHLDASGTPQPIGMYGEEDVRRLALAVGHPRVVGTALEERVVQVDVA